MTTTAAVIQDALDAVQPSDPRAARDILEALAPSGFTFLPAPVGGNSAPAAELEVGLWMPTGARERGGKSGGVTLWKTCVTFYGGAIELLDTLPPDLVAKYRHDIKSGVQLLWGRPHAWTVGGGPGSRSGQAAEATGCPVGACNYAHPKHVACEDA